MVRRTCGTCEFNDDGFCMTARHGEAVFKTEEQQTCWSCGPKYFDELLNGLPEESRLEYLNFPLTRITFDDVLAWHETGKSLPRPNSRRKKQAESTSGVH